LRWAREEDNGEGVSNPQGEYALLTFYEHKASVYFRDQFYLNVVRDPLRHSGLIGKRPSLESEEVHEPKFRVKIQSCAKTSTPAPKASFSESAAPPLSSATPFERPRSCRASSLLETHSISPCDRNRGLLPSRAGRKTVIEAPSSLHSRFFYFTAFYSNLRSLTVAYGLIKMGSFLRTPRSCGLHETTLIISSLVVWALQRFLR